MKKAILTLAVLCGIGMTAMAQTDIQNDTAIFPYDMFLAPEHPPEFIGGEDSLYAFLKKNVHYPKEAIEKKVEGKVFVSFIVEKDGSITNAKGETVSTDTGSVSVILDGTSTWTLTADSYVTEFSGDPANVFSNGYTLYVGGTALTGTN